MNTIPYYELLDYLRAELPVELIAESKRVGEGLLWEAGLDRGLVTKQQVEMVRTMIASRRWHYHRPPRMRRDPLEIARDEKRRAINKRRHVKALASHQ